MDFVCTGEGEVTAVDFVQCWLNAKSRDDYEQVKGLACTGLNEDEKGNEDSRECVEWILKNQESKRLFERYGDRMPLLQPLLTQASLGH